MDSDKINIFWFRRDLRTEDNKALFHALKKGNVLPIFIFDNNILNLLPDSADTRVSYIFQQLQKINKVLLKHSSALKILYGNPVDIYKELVSSYNINSVFYNEDYEPYALKRDTEIKNILKNKGIGFLGFRDHVLLHPGEVLKADGQPYTVYTPFAKKWKSIFFEQDLKSYTSESLLNQCIKNPVSEFTLKEIGFIESKIKVPKINLSDSIILNYKDHRDFPIMEGTTYLGTALRFGSISIRSAAQIILNKSETLLNELIWREFFIQILYHFPQVVSFSFKRKYDNIIWRNNENDFESWKTGMTGYPIVDAGMRQLNSTGLMHNRVRMITASFLCKHLLIDWRWGESYFASKLLDYELASNNGNWQWASGSGCDAAPYFRVFNPALQTQKFDPKFKYIRKWVPEFEEFNYPLPIVEHNFARERAILTYKNALKNEMEL